jgi:hypothetical protein
VNPADPTGISAEAILAEATRAGARVVAVAVTDLDPPSHAGVEMFAAGLALSVVAGVGTARTAPYPVTELRDGDEVPFGDVRLVAEGSGQRPWGAERLRYIGLDWTVPPR